MLKRKIEKQLLHWKNSKERNPLILKGCRQCGKTWSVNAFAKEQYKNVIYLNFFENPNYKEIFSGALEVDHLTMMMSVFLGPEISFEANETIIILDEIQECPEARTALKFFKLDGRYDVLCTGSLLGVKGYGERPASIPVGYESILEMYPLDFEEFLWANGISEEIITMLQGYLQREDLHSYQDDMLKYAEKADKGRIRDCFSSIPKQLSKENKKFKYSLVKKGSTASQYLGSLQWIEDAGIISRCYNLTTPELPLSGNAIPDIFKVYMNDTGLFVAMLDDGTQFDILQGNLYSYKGAIFENLIAGIFQKMGRKLYYFHKDSGLEVDFVIRYQGKATLVEVKASTGNTKSTKTVLKNKDKYHVEQAIKIGDYNLGREGEILTVPHYMAFLLREL